MDSHTSSNSTASTEVPVGQGSRVGYVPYTGMYMGQMPWPPLYLPHPNATAQVADASAFQHYGSGGNNVVPAQLAAVPASGVDTGDAHNSLQSTQPVSVVNIAHATYNQSFINSYHSYPAAIFPPQHSLMLPRQYNQPNFQLGAFTGTGIVQPPIYGVPQHLPFPIRGPHLQEQGDGLASTLPAPSQDTLSAGRMLAARARRDREENAYSKISKDMDFKQLEATDNLGNHKFQCLRKHCGKVIIASSYLNHIESGSHRGDKRGTCICNMCYQMFSRPDAVKRHQLTCGKKRVKVEAPHSVFDTSQDSMSPAPSMEGHTVPFTYHEPAATTSMSDTSLPLGVGNVPTAPLEETSTQAPNTDVFADSLVPPVPVSSESQETTVAPVTRDDFLPAFGNLHPDVWALLGRTNQDAPSPNQPKTLNQPGTLDQPSSPVPVVQD